MGLLDFILGRNDDAPRPPDKVVSMSTADILAAARKEGEGKHGSKQITIPNRWVFVWAVRLDNHADNPQCRAVFRRSVLSNKEGIRNMLGEDLLALLEKTASGDDPEEYGRLAPILFDFQRKMKTQE